ncbi:MotA/TolQ/ExbB proton channel family protein [Peijinzhouia sedimentorum]
MNDILKPYFSPENPGDWITIIFTLGIFIYFIVELIRFINRTSKLNKDIEAFDASSVRNDNEIYSAWLNYKSTFGFGGLQKTKEDAQYYFNESSLILKNSNLRYFFSLPNIFVGLGILGTFVGLVYGISSFEYGDSQEIKDGINVLLSGMATAFYTSVTGMFFSILFNIIEKKIFYKSYRKINQLVQNLNDEYRLSIDAFEKHEKQSIIEAITETLSYRDSEGNLTPPKEVFYTINHELKEQSRALKSFSTDLANGLDAMSHVILEEFDLSFQKAFKETLLPVIEKLKLAVDALKNEKTATNENLINTTITSLKDVMQKMMQDFKTHLSGTAKTELESVLEVIKISSNSLLELPTQMKNIESSLESTVLKLNKISEDTQKVHSAGVEEAIKERTQLSSITNATIDKATLMMDSAGRFIENFTSEAEVLTQAISKYNGLINSLDETANSINEASEKLNDSARFIDEYSRRNMESSRLLSENFDRQLSEVTQMNRHHIDSYDRIKESLNEVFEGIDEGLIAYRDHTQQSLNTYLGEFSEKLARASSSLSGSISELNDGLDNLNDFLGKIRNS